MNFNAGMTAGKPAYLTSKHTEPFCTSIAVAFILAVLASDTIAHPPIQAVLTSDEEIGMLGARDLDTPYQDVPAKSQAHSPYPEEPA